MNNNFFNPFDSDINRRPRRHPHHHHGNQSFSPFGHQGLNGRSHFPSPPPYGFNGNDERFGGPWNSWRGRFGGHGGFGPWGPPARRWRPDDYSSSDDDEEPKKPKDSSDSSDSSSDSDVECHGKGKHHKHHGGKKHGHCPHRKGHGGHGKHGGGGKHHGGGHCWPPHHHDHHGPPHHHGKHGGHGGDEDLEVEDASNFGSDYQVIHDDVTNDINNLQLQDNEPEDKTNKKCFKVALNADGYKAKEIRIRRHQNQLLVEGKQNAKTFLGTFQRSFSYTLKIPSGVNAKKIKTKLGPDGVLRIKAKKVRDETDTEGVEEIPIKE